MSKPVSIKSRIYRLGYVVVVGCSASLAFLVYSQGAVGKQNERTFRYGEARRNTNKAFAYYGYSLAAFRGAMLDPANKDFRADIVRETDNAHQELEKLRGETTDSKEIQELVENVFALDKSAAPIESDILKFLDHGDRKSAERLYYERHVAAYNQVLATIEKTRVRVVDIYEQVLKERNEATRVRNLIQILIQLLLVVSVAIYSFITARGVSKRLEELGNELSVAADSVKTATSSVTSSSQTLSATTTQQAAAIEETVSSMEEMSSMLSQTAQNTTTTLSVAEEGQREAERGKQVIAQMISAMEEIHSSNSRLESIVKMIDEIKSKTKVINDIVFETRLLSFNASIEAARAGAHGKGFAVVAEEVGKLAAMSGKAAEQIRDLLETSTTEVASVVRGTQERVNVGKTISQDCEQVFGVMSRSLEKIGESVRMITTATKEQESGVRQTNQAMGEMDQVTQRNSASAESLANQARQLNDGAISLVGSIQQLKQMIFGSESTQRPQQLAAVTRPEPMITTAPRELQAAKTLQSPEVEPATKPTTSRSDSRWRAA